MVKKQNKHTAIYFLNIQEADCRGNARQVCGCENSAWLKHLERMFVSKHGIFFLITQRTNGISIYCQSNKSLTLSVVVKHLLSNWILDDLTLVPPEWVCLKSKCLQLSIQIGRVVQMVLMRKMHACICCSLISLSVAACSPFGLHRPTLHVA